MSGIATMWFNNVLFGLLQEGFELQAMISMSVSMSVESEEPKRFKFILSHPLTTCW